MSYNILSIIDPTMVRAVAFANVSSLPDEMICEADIEYAISKYIVPVTGHKLMCAVSRGEYSNLRCYYLHSAIAFYVRYISAYDSEQESVRILSRARHFLRVLSDHLEENKARYAEYSSAENILKRCRIHGNLVQVL